MIPPRRPGWVRCRWALAVVLISGMVSSAAMATQAGPIGGVHRDWGLTPTELSEKSGGTIQTFPLPIARLFGLRPGALGHTQTLDVLYLFTPMGGRLAGIQVTPRDMGSCADWLSELRASLGEPDWTEGGTFSAKASWSDLVTEYQFKGAGPAKKMTCLLLLTPVQPLPERG